MTRFPVSTFLLPLVIGNLILTGILVAGIILLFQRSNVHPGIPQLRDPVKNLARSDRGLVVRLISVNDDWSEELGNNPPLLVQYIGKGNFLNSCGNFVFSGLNGLLKQTDEDRKSGRKAYLLIDVRKGASLDELVDVLNQLRAVTPADTNALIWLRVDGLKRLSPPRKNQ